MPENEIDKLANRLLQLKQKKVITIREKIEYFKIEQDLAVAYTKYIIQNVRSNNR